MKVLKWLDDNLEEKVLSLILWAMVIVMGFQVVARYIFNSSLTWSEELLRYLFIWLAFIGMSYCVKNGSHMRIDIIEQLVPKTKKVFAIIGDVFFFIFASYMIRPGFSVIKSLKDSGQTSPASGIPMYIIYSILLVGFILVIFRIVEKYIKIYLDKKKGAA
ncbi:TRAP transporter small permease [Sedimentibacter sp.]|uniref:TRAP transporter small permease n=3 Tax=Sedimentibacter sp. TaxID=1960295 RepID=UPI000EE138CD|nr:TRAP transporter small permease [Sedimentibacter sp.]HCX62926.1 TRAP transporter small permease [Clostridiales bacterium]